jgi:hypothetical protein
LKKSFHLYPFLISSRAISPLDFCLRLFLKKYRITR